MGHDGDQRKSQDEHIVACKEEKGLIWFKGKTAYNQVKYMDLMLSPFSMDRWGMAFMILAGHCFTGGMARGPAHSNRQQFLVCLHLPQPWSSAPSPEMCLLIFHIVNYVSKFLHRIQKSDLIWDIPFTLGK